MICKSPNSSSWSKTYTLLLTTMSDLTNLLAFWLALLAASGSQTRIIFTLIKRGCNYQTKRSRKQRDYIKGNSQETHLPTLPNNFSIDSMEWSAGRFSATTVRDCWTTYWMRCWFYMKNINLRYSQLYLDFFHIYVWKRIQPPYFLAIFTYNLIQNRYYGKYMYIVNAKYFLLFNIYQFFRGT